MFGFNNATLDFYKSEYENFIRLYGAAQSYLDLANKATDFSPLVKLLYYKAKTDVDRLVLVVPSLFNSPEILFISGQGGLIDEILNFSNIYVIDWQDGLPDYKLENYIKEILNVLEYLRRVVPSKKIDILGHCIGGNLAMVAATLDSYMINSLSLFTTPWDYSHFKIPVEALISAGFENLLWDLSAVPELYIELMFFLLSPQQFQGKLDKYMLLNNAAEKHHFMQVESWLHSGKALSKELYRQIIQEVVLDNMFLNKKLVDPELINVPVCLVIAENDNIVPPSSILPLQEAIKEHYVIRVKGGHISYLLGKKTQFVQEYTNCTRSL